MIEDEPQIEVEPDLEGRVVLIVHGSLDLPEVGPLRAALQDICSGDCPAVVVDLSDVTFIGSSGLGVLVQAKQELDKPERSLVLRGVGSRIRRTFAVTHLDQVFDFEDVA